MTSTTVRKAAFASGALYIATFIFSIPTLGMKAPLDDPNFVLGAGNDAGVIWGSIFDVICGLAGIGTAVVLYPILKRESTTKALGFVTTRVVEAGALFVGAMSLMALVAVRGDVVGGNSSALVTVGESLVAFHDAAFMFGPGVMPALNALMFATILYRTGLVPRWMPRLGLIAAPILLASTLASLFGWQDEVSVTATLTALPIATWEFSVGVYMLVKGFRSTPLTEAFDAEHALLASA